MVVELDLLNDVGSQCFGGVNGGRCCRCLLILEAKSFTFIGQNRMLGLSCGYFLGEGFGLLCPLPNLRVYAAEFGGEILNTATGVGLLKRGGGGSR